MANITKIITRTRVFSVSYPLQHPPCYQFIPNNSTLKNAVSGVDRSIAYSVSSPLDDRARNSSNSVVLRSEPSAFTGTRNFVAASPAVFASGTTDMIFCALITWSRDRHAKWTSRRTQGSERREVRPFQQLEIVGRQHLWKFSRQGSPLTHPPMKEDSNDSGSTYSCDPWARFILPSGLIPCPFDPQDIKAVVDTRSTYVQGNCVAFGL